MQRAVVLTFPLTRRERVLNQGCCRTEDDCKGGFAVYFGERLLADSLR